jgi:TatD DNase family protein
VTFKNGKIDQFLNEIPLDKIVLETDSPYLAPVPYRGKRNESAYLELVAGKLVDIYKTNFTEIDRVTTDNALNYLKYKNGSCFRFSFLFFQKSLFLGF